MGQKVKRRRGGRRRREIMRRRRIAASVLVALLVLVIVLVVFAFKSCNGGTSGTGQGSGGTGQYSSGSGGNGTSGGAQGENTSSENGTSSENAVASGGEIGTTQAQTLSASDLSDGITERFTTATGHEGYVKDGVTYIDGYLIANKTYSLPSTFVPTDPDVPVTSGSSRTSLDKTLMENFRKMQSDAAALGLNIYIASGYRSYSTQVTLYNNYVATDGSVLADTYSSRAGHSEHQTGLCFDLNSIEDSFQYTDEGKWVNDNAYKYGFIIRFPKGKDDKTGYQYESWHLRYVGTDLSYKLYNNGDWISMEEYFGITSSYE
jgi:D-alanyl-D-alanine carboxypeptidase